MSNCVVCNAPIQHVLSKSQVQYACGTAVKIQSYQIGSDAIKTEVLITGKCANGFVIKMGVKE